jgi:hypothetical protein
MIPIQHLTEHAVIMKPAFTPDLDHAGFGENLQVP